MRIAALQMKARAGDVAGNLAAIRDGAAEAAGRGAELLVAPELAITGYGAGDAIRARAEPRDGAQIEALAKVAAEHAIALICGFAERDGDRLYNSAAALDQSGLMAVYRKCHLYGPYEGGLFAPGDGLPPVVLVCGMRVGILICYDVEFPEAVRWLALAGAEIVAVPTALPDSSHAAFIAEKIVPVRAFENQVAVVYANHAAHDGRFSYAGRSCIALPDGTDAARAGADGAELIVADYRPEDFAASRAENPYLADRRSDLF